MRADLIKNISLVWRKAKHDRRIVVGVISRSANNYTFRYVRENLPQAVADGFVNYPDFPDLTKTYTENVMSVFAQRLNNPNRADIESYFKFWEIDPRFKDDKYYILAQTQGLLSTDNFEFIASYYLKKNLSFISEIAGITKYDVKGDFLSIGDKLSWKCEDNNKYDSYAVKVFKGNKHLGYIKKVHSEVFYDKRAKNLKIRVKDIDKNGLVNRAFIVVYNEA